MHISGRKKNIKELRYGLTRTANLNDIESDQTSEQAMWYASKLNLSIDYQIPDFVTKRYSHVMWYNR